MTIHLSLCQLHEAKPFGAYGHCGVNLLTPDFLFVLSNVFTLYQPVSKEDDAHVLPLSVDGGKVLLLKNRVHSLTPES